MCHAASLKHVVAMAETSDSGIQNGTSILDAAASLSATVFLVDVQTNSELIDSSFQSIHAKFYSWKVLFSITVSSVSVQADYSTTNSETYLLLTFYEKSGNLEQIVDPSDVVYSKSRSHLTYLPS